MRVARLYGTGDIRVGDEPEPAGTASVRPHEDDEALVRVTAVGICGSDLHWWTEGAIGDAKLSRPLVLGHEGAGVIAAGPRRGERVAIDPAIPCEACRACHDGYRNLCYNIRFAGHGETDGMLREQLRWPARLLYPLPDQVSDDAGALLEPLGVALHAMDLGHVPFGGRVTVVGCGPIGLLLLQVLRVAGAGPVTAVEPLPHRREAAAGYGADQVAEPDADLTGYGADVAFEVAGTDEAVRLAMQSVRPGGRVVLAGHSRSRRHDVPRLARQAQGAHHSHGAADERRLSARHRPRRPRRGGPGPARLAPGRPGRGGDRVRHRPAPRRPESPHRPVRRNR